MTEVVEKIETYILFSISFFFLKILPFYDVMWKNVLRNTQAIDDNMAHTLCLLDN